MFSTWHGQSRVSRKLGREIACEALAYTPVYKVYQPNCDVKKWFDFFESCIQYDLPAWRTYLSLLPGLIPDLRRIVDYAVRHFIRANVGEIGFARIKIDVLDPIIRTILREQSAPARSILRRDLGLKSPYIPSERAPCIIPPIRRRRNNSNNSEFIKFLTADDSHQALLNSVRQLSKSKPKETRGKKTSKPPVERLERQKFTKEATTASAVGTQVTTAPIVDIFSGDPEVIATNTQIVNKRLLIKSEPSSESGLVMSLAADQSPIANLEQLASLSNFQNILPTCVSSSMVAGPLF